MLLHCFIPSSWGLPTNVYPTSSVCCFEAKEVVLACRRGYKEGVVYLEMKGACSGCPSSTATLRHGVQNLFRHFLPEIREVQAI